MNQVNVVCVWFWKMLQLLGFQKGTNIRHCLKMYQVRRSEKSCINNNTDNFESSRWFMVCTYTNDNSTLHVTLPWTSIATSSCRQIMKVNLYMLFAMSRIVDSSWYLSFVSKPEPPESPRNLTVLSKTSRSVTLGWYPGFNGNSPLTGFTLEYKNDTGNI